MNRRRLIMGLVALAAAALGLGVALLRAGPGDGTGFESATVLTHPRPLPEFALHDHRDEPFGPVRLGGGWDVLFFGFTHCPDICPTTLATVARARAALDDLPAGQRPRVWFVSVDPARDDATTLAGYVHHFHPEFGGVTGAASALADLAEGVGAAYTLGPPDEQGHYPVAHTSALFVVDTHGRLAAVFTPPHDAAAIAADLRRLVTNRG